MPDATQHIDFTSLVTTGQQTNQVLTAILATLNALRTTIGDIETTLAAGIIVTPAPSAAAQSVVAAPTAPASTTAFTMQGLGVSITPIRTGVLLITISGTALAATVTAGDGIAAQISYGTGAAPVNGATLTGTQIGAVQENANPTTVIAADVRVPFAVQAVVTGLALGTAYWIDLAAKSLGTASSGSLSAISVSAVEV